MTERRTDDRGGSPPPALTAVVLGLIAVVLGVCAVVAFGETSARALASYTPVEAMVLDQHDEERLVADRRGSNRDSFRVVSVELPDGTRADLRSDDLAVGTTATVYRSDSGAVFEAPPSRPGILEWVLCAVVSATAIMLAIVSARLVFRLRRST